MAIARVKTWSSGEVLTASDLNAEYNNILNNPIDLWSPAGKAADFNGFEVIMDADADTSITADTDDRLDFRLGGVDLFIFNGTTTSCVNGLTLFGTATGTNAYIRANGSDANTAIDLRDANGNELIKTAAVASAVSEVSFTNAATGNPARIHATGETNVSLQIEPKGSGTVLMTDGTDTTKKASMVLSAISTATTRTITMPDANVDLQYSRAASDTVAGGIEIAIQSEMEAGSDTGRAVTPGRQQFHPSAAKGWVQGSMAAADGASYNVASITDNGTGDFTVNWATDFSSANYAVFVSAHQTASSGNRIPAVRAKAAGTTQVVLYFVSDTSGGATLTEADLTSFHVIAFGDQA